MLFAFPARTRDKRLRDHLGARVYELTDDDEAVAPIRQMRQPDRSPMRWGRFEFLSSRA
jgi:hypothetical protein